MPPERIGDAMATFAPRSADLVPGPGFRVRVDVRRPAPSVSLGLAEFATAEISDRLNRLFAVDPAIRPMVAGAPRLAGPACTAKLFPGDNLMVHKALDIARPGDVIVVDAARSLSTAVLGDTICTKARHRGIAGFVVDGLVRDVEAIGALGMPVFARGASAVGPLHRGPGELNHPVCLGGVVVAPGDVIVADGDGIVVVPAGFATELLDLLRGAADGARSYAEAVARGEFSNAWVDAILDRHGCVVDPDLDDPLPENGSR